jgi:hypothetical protein
VSVSNASAAEGSGPPSGLTFTVRLSAPTTLPVSVQFAVVGGSANGGFACGPGVDFVAQAGSLAFAPGQTVATVAVPVCDDGVNEPGESLSLILSNPVNAVLGVGTATGTIGNANDDPGQFAPSEDDPAKLTEEQRRQKQRTNTGGLDDAHTEGDVVDVSGLAGDPPSVVIANRDGLVTVVLLGEAKRVAPSIRVGQYLQAEGEKVHEHLFEAHEVDLD